MALVMAIGITTVLAIAGTTAIAYSTSSATQATQSRARQSTFSLAEAGMANAMAVLNFPTNNALDKDTLPKCTTNEMKYTASGAARTSVSTWTRATINGGTASWCGTLRREGRTLVRDVDRVATEPDRSQRRLGWPDARGHGHRCAQVAAAAQQPGLELPLCGPHRQHVRPVSQQQHLGLLADVRGRQSLPEPERPACAVDGDRRREPRRLEQRRGWRQHQLGHESRDLCGWQLPLLRRLVGPVLGQPGREPRLQQAHGRNDGGKPHCARDRSPRRRLRQVVRERHPGACAELHDLERKRPHLRRQLPDQGQQRLDRVRPDPGELVHVPRRSRSEHDPRRRDDGLPDDADRRLCRPASRPARSRSGSTTST